MSLRRGVSESTKLKQELEALKGSQMNGCDAIAAFENLSPVEQSAASLGVDPAEWKPIAFLNNKHYDQLVRSNLLDDDLARRIEAFRAVSASSD